MSLIGKQFNGFKLLRLLGSGGMGEVYYAFHDEMKREAAVKVLYQKEMMKRFKNEAYIQASVSHKNITRLYEFGEIDSKPCIAMEFVNGLTLDQYVQNKPFLSNEKIKHIFQQVCDAVYYLHKKAIQHRDIKPSNIKITSDGLVKLLDFGISKAKYTPKLTKEGYLVGTVDFMSPEQFKGFNSIQSDVWALGVLLYFLCTKELPFQASNVVEQRTKINNATYETPVVFNENIDRKYVLMIRRMLSAKSSKRPYIKELIENLNDTSDTEVPVLQSGTYIHFTKYLPWVLGFILLVISLKFVLNANPVNDIRLQAPGKIKAIEVVVQNSNRVSLELPDGTILSQSPFLVSKQEGKALEIVLKEGKYSKKLTIQSDFNEDRFMCTMDY